MNIQEVNGLYSAVVYKQLNEEDFSHDLGYETVKNIIEPTVEGYISQQVQNALRLDIVDTVVINAGVGQGKTHTIMQIAKGFFDNGFALVFAVPYKSLIDQYFKELTDLGVSETQIFDYRNVENIPVQEASHYPIHLITANSIIGNPGEDFFIQSAKKIEYLNTTIDFLNRSGSKVILIFDEIHDAVHNFQEKYIFNLWKWRGIIHKIFIVSATYNEAAKIVIKYLAELTENRIHIIESTRLKIADKQSDLYLILNNSQKYNADDQQFATLFDDLLNRGKKPHILSFSISLVDDIVKGKIGGMLREKFGKENIRICTSLSDDKFDSSKVNIGTTFSTGINIKGRDDVLVIFLPSQRALSDKRLGVFSNGINAIIQSVARMRDKSEIYIITPSPKYLIDFVNNEGINYCEYIFDNDYVTRVPTKNLYYDINNQRELIKQLYDQIKNNVLPEIDLVSALHENRNNKPSLRFPSLDNYILSDGEKILSTKYEIFGKDLSVYILWAAFNNQFLNCNLKGISKKDIIRLEDDQIIQGLRDAVVEDLFEFRPYGHYDLFLNGYYSEEITNKTDLEFYNWIRDYIFHRGISIGNLKIKRSSVTFNNLLLTLIQLLKKSNDDLENKCIVERQINNEIGYSINDIPFTDSEYFLACLSNALEAVMTEEFSLINAYKILGKLYLEQVPSRFLLRTDDDFKYFINIDSEVLNQSEIDDLRNAIEYLKMNDPLIKLNLISFFQDELPLDNVLFLKKIKSSFLDKFYSKNYTRVRINNLPFRVTVVQEKFPLPVANSFLNFL